MSKQELISENGKHMTDESLAAIEQIADADFAALQAAAEAIDASDIGIDCEVAITRETLKDFENSRATKWAEKGKRTQGEGFITYENIQLTKGERRQTLAVIDCGDFRACLTA